MIFFNQDLIVVDVREENEYCDEEPPSPSVAHIPDSLNYPWITGVLEANYEELPSDGDILVVCRSGSRSFQASNFLCTNGYTSIYNMTSGMLAWEWETVGCCYSQAECDDGLYCTGEESCVDLNCQPGTVPCTQPYYMCDEDYDVCAECPDDYDCDSLTDSGDNCFEVANGPASGTCARTVSGGIVMGTGITCTSDDDCGSGEICQMNQEDYNANGAGDVCECYADIDGDGNVYPGDLMTMIAEYGRTDCLSNPPCEADIDGDGNVYPSDMMIMIAEYGRDNCPAVP